MITTASPQYVNLYAIDEETDNNGNKYDKPVHIGYTTNIVINIDGNKFPIFTLGTTAMRAAQRGPQQITGYIDTLNVTEDFLEFARRKQEGSYLITQLEKDNLPGFSGTQENKSPKSTTLFGFNQVSYYTKTLSTLDNVSVSRMYIIAPTVTGMSKLASGDSSSRDMFSIIVMLNVRFVGFSQVTRAQDVATFTRVQFVADLIGSFQVKSS